MHGVDQVVFVHRAGRGDDRLCQDLAAKKPGLRGVCVAKSHKNVFISPGAAGSSTMPRKRSFNNCALPLVVKLNSKLPVTEAAVITPNTRASSVA